MTDKTASRRTIAWPLWLGVLLAFVLLIGAWTLLIYIAVENKPETVEIEQP